MIKRGESMQKVYIDDLRPGMILAKDIFVSGQLISSKGLILSDISIEKFYQYKLVWIDVEDEVSEAFTESVKKDLSYNERVRKSPEFKKFKQRFDDAADTLKDTLNDVVEKNIPLDVDALLSPVMDTMQSLETKISVFDMMQNMRNYDDATYVHSLNVALICNIFSRWLDFSNEDTRIATACGLLHDVGKITIDKSIIQKPGKLTSAEYDIIKNHTKSGYDILIKQDIDEHIKNVALMHHERYDGTGYPNGLRGNEIDKFARLVAIADVYDAMTASRVYRDAMCPFEVISMFEEEGYQKYDTEYLIKFLDNIENTYLLNRVRLNNGREGEIVFINRDRLSKPTVKCGMDFIDLCIQKDLYIESII